MLRASSLIAISVSLAVFGCSSGDFETGQSDDDSGADDVSVLETSADARDTGVTTDSGGNGETTDATTDSATIEASTDSGADTRDSAIADGAETCGTTNACGGCAVLSGAPGDTCGACGKLACATDANSLTCTGDHPKNECGGCATLTGHKGDSCCGGGTLGCSTDGNTLVCSISDNGCGGCAPLDHPKGATCGGVCGTATYQCSGKDATVCTDPVPASPAKGSTCGSCGTWDCNSSGSALICTGDHAPNACGGCATLSGTPGTACGTCGAWTCSADKNSVSCVEAVPAPGTGCPGGQCGTATYQCAAPGITTCVDPLASPPKPKVGDPCNACGDYACNAGKTDIICVGSPSTASRCTATHFGCDVPTCNADGSCSYPPNDSLCLPSSGNPSGCSVDTCTDGATCPPAGDPEPQIKCGSPVSGCTQKLASDADFDGYSTVASCFLSKSASADCNDSNKYVFPNETTYYECPITVSPTSPPTSCSTSPVPETTANWDYNCNGTVDHFSNTIGGCTKSGTTCITKVGWEGSIPSCGQSGGYIDFGGCTYDPATFGCDISDSTQIQGCR